MHSRREFVKGGSLAALALGLRRPLKYAEWERVAGAAIRLEPDLAELGARALQAARDAGATYADVRFSLIETRHIGLVGAADVNEPESNSKYAVGVRAFVDGVFGFVGGPAWTPDAVAGYARDAVAQAKLNAWGGAGRVELAPCPAVRGAWTMPIGQDPLTVPIADVMARLREANLAARAVKGTSGTARSDVIWIREDKTFMSTEGAAQTQRLYSSGVAGRIEASVADGTRRSQRQAGQWFEGRGYEVIDAFDVAMVRAAHQAVEDLAVPMKNLDVGRYDLILDAKMTAKLVARSIGNATQIDRACGYEANGFGTSYIAPPEKVLGTMRMGPELLSVTADRSQPGSAAWVRWDDEGVEPEEFPLVEKGIVAGYQTTRAQVALLPGPDRLGRSHGCAGAPDAATVQMQVMPNLSLHPGRGEASFEDLIAGTKRGIAIVAGEWGDVTTDQQCLTGEGWGEFVYEIRGGKRVARLPNAIFWYKAPELWKGLTVLGGPASQEVHGMHAMKEPTGMSTTRHSVRAVPASFANVRILDRGATR